MRDLIVQWLTQITAPFWKAPSFDGSVCHCPARNVSHGIFCHAILAVFGALFRQ